MKNRKVSEIEKEYISDKITKDNINVENVIVHSSIQTNSDITYQIEVHHDDKVTEFTGNKKMIDDLYLTENYITTTDIFNIIKKTAKDCEILCKYKGVLNPVLFEHDKFAFVLDGDTLSGSLFTTGKGIDYFTTNSFRMFNCIISITIDSNNHSKTDRIYNKSIRLTYDAIDFNYTRNNSDNAKIEYFTDFTPDDYFALSTINSISKESFTELHEIYKVLKEIKYTKYKIKFDEPQIRGYTSHYRKCVLNYLTFDLEKHILEEIETQYADHIKIP